jgi:nitrite reductase/ring-hydroxylating ferredoxin subunit
MVLGRILGLFRRRAALVKGAGRLEEGQARTVDLGDPLAGGKQIVLARRGGKLFALDSACPHEGGRIVGGPLLEGRFVLCPLHNYRFDVETGRAWNDVCGKARVYAVRQVGEDAEVRA